MRDGFFAYTCLGAVTEAPSLSLVFWDAASRFPQDYGEFPTFSSAIKTKMILISNLFDTIVAFFEKMDYNGVDKNRAFPWFFAGFWYYTTFLVTAKVWGRGRR